LKAILIEIEDVIEPAFAFAFVIIGVFTIFAVMFVIVVVVSVLPVVGDHGGTFDELVQLAAVEPYAAALRTIVNLHALSLIQQKFYLTNRTYHLPFSFNCMLVSSVERIYSINKPDGIEGNATG
jgi:hypothetical protein